jgi:hypothetical protein
LAQEVTFETKDVNGRLQAAGIAFVGEGAPSGAAGDGGGSSNAKTFEQALAEAKGDASKIQGLVMPKAHAGGAEAAMAEESSWAADWRAKGQKRGKVKGEHLRAKKDAARKDSDSFQVACDKDAAAARVLAFVEEERRKEHDLRHGRSLDVVTLTSMRKGFQTARETDTQGVQWSMKLALVNCVLFSKEEVTAGLKDGDKTELRVSYGGGFERKAFWTVLDQLKAEVQRSGRKWRRAGADPVAVQAAQAAAAPAAAAAAEAAEPINLDPYDSAEQLLFKGPGPAALKVELARLGLKAGPPLPSHTHARFHCLSAVAAGGAPADRAARLFLAKVPRPTGHPRSPPTTGQALAELTHQAVQGLELAEFKRLHPKEVAGGKQRKRKQQHAEAFGFSSRPSKGRRRRGPARPLRAAAGGVPGHRGRGGRLRVVSPKTLPVARACVCM